MVKADPSRNYYADLKVPATATESEIRKAFRTLALQYHPDRNPGREAEFVVKFQEIQAAHEILSDHTQRAKYDNERKKYRGLNTPNTPRARPPPPTRNSYATTTPSGSYYRAPPPKPPQRPPPPQHHASYASGYANNTYRAPPTAPKPQETAQKDAYTRANAFTAWQKMKSPRESREAYQARTGRDPSAPEKPDDQSHQSSQHNPNGTPFGRSQSTRVPSSRRGFDPGMPGGDEGQAKSAYRNYARPAPTPPSSTTPPHQWTPPSKTSPADEVPYSEANRVRTPYYSSAGGERTSMFEGLGRSASVRNSPTNPYRPNSGMDPGSYSDSGRRQQRNSYGGKNTNPFRHMYPDSSEDDSDLEASRSANKHRDPPVVPQPPPPQTTQRPPPPPSSWNANGFAGSQIPRRTSNGATGNAPNNFKSRSEESINIKFSPSDWDGKFQSGTDYFAPDMQKGVAARGRTSPTRGRQAQRPAADRNPFTQKPMGPPPPVSPYTQPNAQYPSFPIPPPPPGPPPNLNYPRADANAHKAEFKAEDWAKTFKEPTWVFSDQKETSPRRGTDAAKKPPKATRKGSVAQEKRPKAQEQQEAKTEKRHQATVDDADAMDIDTSTPPVTKRSTPKKGSRTAPSSPRREHSSYAMPNGTAARSSSTHQGKHDSSALHGLGKMARDDLFTSARDSQDGGIALEELGQTLPYESQASNLHPTKPNAAQKLKFPNLPRPPNTPPKLDQAFVELYVSQFEAYVNEYRKVRQKIIEHFVARDTELEHDLEQRFAHHRGETSKKIGFASYMAKMKEDEVVAETLKYFQEQHLLALAQCEEVRNKTIKLYSTTMIAVALMVYAQSLGGATEDAPRETKPPEDGAGQPSPRVKLAFKPLCMASVKERRPKATGFFQKRRVPYDEGIGTDDGRDKEGGREKRKASGDGPPVKKKQKVQKMRCLG